MIHEANGSSFTFPLADLSPVNSDPPQSLCAVWDSGWVEIQSPSVYSRSTTIVKSIQWIFSFHPRVNRTDFTGTPERLRVCFCPLKLAIGADPVKSYAVRECLGPADLNRRHPARTAGGAVWSANAENNGHVVIFDWSTLCLLICLT